MSMRETAEWSAIKQILIYQIYRNHQSVCLQMYYGR